MSLINVTINEIINPCSVTINEVTDTINVQVSEVINSETITISEQGTRGLSAYEIAVQNGYIGTEQQFATDLVEQDVDFNAYYILSKT